GAGQWTTLVGERTGGFREIICARSRHAVFASCRIGTRRACLSTDAGGGALHANARGAESRGCHAVDGHLVDHGSDTACGDGVGSVGAFPLLGVTSMAGAAAPYADPIIFLFLGGFVLGCAMERCNLHRRL